MSQQDDLNAEFEAAPEETKILLSDFLSPERVEDLDAVLEDDPASLLEAIQDKVAAQARDNEERLNGLL